LSFRLSNRRRADLPEYFKPSDWLLDDTSFSAGGISDQA